MPDIATLKIKFYNNNDKLQNWTLKIQVESKNLVSYS